MSDLDKCIEQQRDLLSRVETMYKGYKEKSDSLKTRGYLTSVLEEIEHLYGKFDKTNEQIISLVHENSLDHKDVPYLSENVCFKFSDLFMSFKGDVLDCMPEKVVRGSEVYASTFLSPVTRSPTETTSNTEAKLPKIALPKFSGDYVEWIPFQDIYSSLVHSNNLIPKVQKFYYLKGSLIGEAANLIKTISATEMNYDSAWSILVNRYHNKRLIADTLIKKLFNIPKSEGSFQNIKCLLDTAQECLSSLSNLDIDTSKWDPILIYLIANKLDFQTRKEWEKSLKSSTEIPSVQEMFSFLERTFRTLESVHDELPSFSKVAGYKPKKFTQKNKLYSNHISQLQNCMFCEKSHSLSKCFKFLALSLKLKNEFLNKKHICCNCFAPGHNHTECKSPFRCHLCKKLHHTLLHVEDNSTATNQPVSSNFINTKLNSSESCQNLKSAQNQSLTNISAHNTQCLPHVLLSTIRLMVKSSSCQYVLRALLDQGSQATLITENAVQLLNLSKQRVYCKVSGVGDKSENLCRSSVNLNLWSLQNNLMLSCNALVLAKLSAYVSKPSTANFKLNKVVTHCLADPNYSCSDPVDIILGSDVFSKIVLPGQSFVDNQLFYQNTIFGWVFSGPTENPSISTLWVNNFNIETILRSFWEQEEILDGRTSSEEEEACEKYFQSTTQRAPSGRYIVRLPFRSILTKNTEPTFQANHINALRRLKSLEHSFSKKGLLCDQYKLFMIEYEKLNHMSKIGTYPADVQKNAYFLPHHGVFKEDSTTTKLRVVFDGSSKLNGQNSINEELCPGPALQNDLPQIITRWRRHKFAFCADIEKMFRQIQVASEHQHFQQILWRHNQTDPISIYKLNTVTYGTTSAPYLAIKVVRQLAFDYKSTYPVASNVLISDSYVDDIISGSDNLADTISLHKNLCALLQQGECKLRKWISNSPDFIEQIPPELREQSATLNFDKSDFVKTLGVQWNTRSDIFSFNVKLDSHEDVTKRSILSCSARLYDPLGWLAPSTVLAKIIYQKLWLAGVGWDDNVPIDILDSWLKYRNSLVMFQNIQIPRWIGFHPTAIIDLHCFCDASQVAYAAAVYARVQTLNNDIFVNLLQAKSKVSPVKTVTIPRLELCAAVLLVKLVSKVKQSLTEVSTLNITFWSDSSTVLSWIRQPPARWSVYVANRVGEIQRHTNIQQWRYVPSCENPADFPSRGIMPEDLITNDLWWHGPTFLKLSESAWPKRQFYERTSLEEIKSKIISNVVSCNSYPDILEKYSSLNKMLRILSLCYRFCKNCRISRELREVSPLKATDLKKTLFSLVKIVQQIDFQSDFESIQKQKGIKTKSLFNLMPIVDDEGFLRVGGRLQNADLPLEMKHPIILTKSNPLSKLIVLDAHQRTLHGGVTLTMSYVNRKLWIISGTQLAKKTISNCIVCFKHTAKTAQQIMGNLPPVRLNVTRPFKHSGVDYAGPILLKNSTLRSAATSKGYICLFVCMVSKALHLEVVSDLTTNSFLAAFRRFVARRGNCTDLYSDCGTNFVGASKELKVLFHKSILSLPKELRDSLVSAGTDWHFNPPASPHFGGLWEAGVKSVKRHLKRVIGDRILSFEELTTLLCQIEGCLNSRPLCALSSDPTNFNPLTPAHFLIGEPTNCIQEENLLDLNINNLTRWKAIEKMKQHFWRRWYGEYLNRLQARPKWLKTKPDAKVGDLVLIADDRCLPGQWSLGRIQEIHPGTDGRVRVVTLLTKQKLLKRPITKICFLPIDNHINDEVNINESNAADDLVKGMEPVPVNRCELKHSGVN